ncbi:hypothetical protein MRB53_038652 [Persea americana]|nr:hypothetical protein MRB53_038652 [Persea americana]
MSRSHPDRPHDDPLLERIRQLERAVFGAEQSIKSPTKAAAPEPGSIMRWATLSLCLIEMLRGSQATSCAELGRSSLRLEDGSPSPAAVPNTLNPPRLIVLPAERDTLDLVHDYRTHCIHLTRIVHLGTVQTMISRIYSQLARGEEPHSDAVALMLAICAESAFFWTSKGAWRTAFESDRAAGEQSFAWRKSSWDLAEQSCRHGVASIEGAQARLIICTMVYLIEGSTSRWRYLLSSIVSISRELGLHMLDNPMYESEESPTAMEIKRRVWWYMVHLDWTYTINPRQMQVRRLRNINDDDASFSDDAVSLPSTVLTDSTFFIGRLYLSTACRQITDLLTETGKEVDELEYDQLQEIESVFQEVMKGMPPALFLESPVPPGTSAQLLVQRKIMHIGINSQRARVFRHFTLPEVISSNPRFQHFRTICYASANAAANIATGMLSDAMDIYEQSSQPLPRHTDIVIPHLFQACVLLATDPILDPNGDASSQADNAARKALRELLSSASRVLQRFSQRSSVAANLVGRLVAVLQRHRVQPVSGNQNGGSMTAPGAGGAGPTSVQQTGPLQQQQQQQQQHLGFNNSNLQPGQYMQGRQSMDLTNSLPTPSSWDTLLANPTSNGWNSDTPWAFDAWADDLLYNMAAPDGLSNVFADLDRVSGQM